jgi:hypothetical protein
MQLENLWADMETHLSGSDLLFWSLAMLFSPASLAVRELMKNSPGLRITFCNSNSVFILLFVIVHFQAWDQQTLNPLKLLPIVPWVCHSIYLKKSISWRKDRN